MNDLNLILPSNSCPLTQPENNAAVFIVDWQNPIELNGKWEAALTEFAYKYEALKTSTKSTIQADISYLKSLFGQAQEIEMMLSKKLNMLVTINDVRIAVYLSKGKLTINAKMVLDKMIVSFKSLRDARLAGFEKLRNETDGNWLQAPNEMKIPAKKGKLIFVKFYVECFSRKNSKNIDYSLEDKTFKNQKELCSHIYESQKTYALFKYFQMTNEGYTSFRVYDNVKHVSFTEDIASSLGLPQNIDTKTNKIYTAQKKSSTTSDSLGDVYIYTSLTEPILVGGVRVPLLKSLLLKDPIKIGTFFHTVIERPMYIPVDSHSINKIEVNIRTDSGSPIPSSYRSKSILTIHLRKL